MALTAEQWARAAAVQANPNAAAREIAEVHALLYPGAEAVCQTCVRKLGEAWRAIARAMRQRPTGTPSLVPSSTLKSLSAVNKTTQRARQFIDPETVYQPHGTGQSFTNKNLTPEVVAMILRDDPDAERLFEPLEEEEADAADAGNEPKPLAKQTKAELVATYTGELGAAPDEQVLNTNDKLRAAIESHRAETK